MKQKTREELKKEISTLKENHKSELKTVQATALAQGAINMAALTMQYLKETIGSIPIEKMKGTKAPDLKAVKKPN